MKVGYCRVSTADQSTLEQQEAELRKLGVRTFEKEKISGTKTDRPVFTALMEELRRGDELYVTKLDRLARSNEELQRISKELEARGITLVFDGNKHDPSTPMGKMIFGMLALLAEFEVNTTRERTRATMASRKALGLPTGGKPRMFTERQEIALLHAVEAGITITELAARRKVSRTTIRRALDRQQFNRQLKVDPNLRREVKLLKLERGAAEKELDAAWADAPTTG